MRVSMSLVAAAAFTLVNAHGGVFNYTIDGVDYPGHYPWLPEAGQVSVQRRWWGDPIYNVSHPYLGCNRGYPLQTTPPMEHAPIKAGGLIEAFYTPPVCPKNWSRPEKPLFPEWNDPKPMVCLTPKSPWYHYWGPLMVYMADCHGPCDKFDSHRAKWFKIWESGYSSTGWPAGSISRAPITDRRTWEQNNLHSNPITVQVPQKLKSGHYLIRHEVFFSEGENGFPQLFPQCAQLHVTGQGNAVPGSDYLVEFPGAYKMTDPAFAILGDDNYSQRRSIYVSIPYQNLSSSALMNIENYTTPGPRVWSP
ncbi:unnamed protein product [Fusarium equiseti]|uniref:lytic cellulose monooxygenase (C4-dehydrogenating) n=1 Tax=Fusarium equiseti TaxID=61235 RepID=A0A8J2J230_FUSEQ|nr:unnamed protein product [Fusarium equiseti]